MEQEDEPLDLKPGDQIRCLDISSCAFLSLRQYYTVLDPPYAIKSDGTTRYARHGDDQWARLVRIQDDSGAICDMNDGYFEWRFELAALEAEIPGLGKVVLRPKK